MRPCPAPLGRTRSSYLGAYTGRGGAARIASMAGNAVRRLGESWSSSRAGRLAPHDTTRAGPRRDRMKFLLLHYADESAEWSAEETREDRTLPAAWLEDTIAS